MENVKALQTVNILIPRETYAALKRIAQKERRSLKQQCVVVLEGYLLEQGAKVEKAVSNDQNA